MGQVLITDTNLTNIANAIRTKSGTTTKYTPANMAAAISAIPGGAFNWMGDGVECLNANLYNTTVQLADTTFSTWTASTTAKSLHSTTSLSTFSADMDDYAYLLRWVTVAHVALKDTATLNTVPCGLQINLFDQQIMRRPNSLVNIEANNYNGNVYVNSASLGWMQYYSTSGSKTYTWASSYGFYGSVPTPTFASSTASPTNVTPKTPILYTRCSTTYFATARKGYIDIDKTYWTIHGELYRMDLTKNCMRQRYTDLIDIINDELE
jgi:hypothetical protein